MKVTRILTRSSLALALAALAACQTAPVQQDTAVQTTDPAATVSEATQAPEPESVAPAASQGAPVAVLLADTVQHEGWRAVQVGTGSTLYLDPRPLVIRDDLTGVQAGANQQGQGLLALMINDSARQRLQDATTSNPNRRLALVVGSTLMAAPSYSEPVTSGQLIFPVGTEDNATAAARAIAGVDETGAPMPPSTDPAGAASTAPRP
ncbi:MAG TPA: hypothetical protein VKZ70_05110 [Burkholderiaceae bacterium]|nr:hypothetical protein [Burkholderiaceae bacterium]